MKITILALGLAAGAIIFSGNAIAEDAAALAKAKGCLNCHDMEKKKAGPALKEIAAKKSGKADELLAKLQSGKGHPKSKATDDELKTLVDWVLAQK